MVSLLQPALPNVAFLTLHDTSLPKADACIQATSSFKVQAYRKLKNVFKLGKSSTTEDRKKWAYMFTRGYTHQYAQMHAIKRTRAMTRTHARTGACMQAHARTHTHASIRTYVQFHTDFEEQKGACRREMTKAKSRRQKMIARFLSLARGSCDKNLSSSFHEDTLHRSGSLAPV